MFAAVLSVQTGRIAPLGLKRVPSAFVKTEQLGAISVSPLGLDGDEQADLSVHGGPEKAVYAYAVSHYPAWAEEFPGLASRFVGGAMGENLTISGMDESNICVGDIHAIGTALLQVCQPRQPCFKFALRHSEPLLPRAMVRSGRAGWYYRVTGEGILQAGDQIELRDRPNPDFPFKRLVEILFHGKATRDELARMAEMSGLASQLQDMAQRYLE